MLNTLQKYILVNVPTEQQQQQGDVMETNWRRS